MGYGVLVGKNEFGDYVQQRETGNNETLGYINALIHYAKDDVTIINLAHKGKSTSAISGTLAYILFDREIVPPYIHQSVAIDTALLNNYVGTYSVPSITTVYEKRRYVMDDKPRRAGFEIVTGVKHEILFYQ